MKEVEQLRSKLRQTKPNSKQALKSNANIFEKVVQQPTTKTNPEETK